MATRKNIGEKAGLIPLCEVLPDLLSICNNPDARVGECWTKQGWDLSFRRLLNDWEVGRVASLLEMLGGYHIITDAPNRAIWRHTKDGDFTGNNAYRRVGVVFSIHLE